MEQIIQQIYKQARLLGACELFTGKEHTLEDIVHLFVTPQGIEFCINNHFPNMETFRLFKPYKIERFGIYIDAGTITLHNPKQAILIGNTVATINNDTLDAHEVILLHGAKAVVNASGWAVCKAIVAEDCYIDSNVTDNAIIL